MKTQSDILVIEINSTALNSRLLCVHVLTWTVCHLLVGLLLGEGQHGDLLGQVLVVLGIGVKLQQLLDRVLVNVVIVLSRHNFHKGRAALPTRQGREGKHVRRFFGPHRPCPGKALLASAAAAQ